MSDIASLALKVSNLERTHRIAGESRDGAETYISNLEAALDHARGDLTLRQTQLDEAKAALDAATAELAEAQTAETEPGVVAAQAGAATGTAKARS